MVVPGIIAFGLLTVISLVFAILAFASSKKTSWIWLLSMLVGMAGLVYCILTAVNSLVDTVGAIRKKIEVNMVNSISSDGGDSHMADSVNSEQKKALKEMGGEGPEQFYHYLGFEDYYRLPLVFPFSLHCNVDTLSADLYNEKQVSAFNENDNGEISCDVYSVTQFVFDKDRLFAKCRQNGKELFVQYDFKTGQRYEFQSEKEMRKAMGKAGLKEEKFLSCMEYYRRLNQMK